MSRIDWNFFIRLGLFELRLRPRDFWDLTPGELMLMAGGGYGPTQMTRAGLEQLAAQFPDVQEIHMKDDGDNGRLSD